MHLNKIEAKIYPDYHSFSETLNKWKNSKETIVFTNGCFDILHRGHIEYLAQTADLGNRLVIGLNSDESVKILKGPLRPFVDEKSRAVLLASLGFVDAVVLFSEETPYNLISDILPEILVKGDDYSIEEIAGFDVVLANGGKVETIKLVPGHSTTSIINKIKSQGNE